MKQKIHATLKEAKEQCNSYYEKNGQLRGCTCGTCPHMKQNELEQIVEKALSRFEIAYFHIKIAVNRYVSEVYGDDSKKEGKKQIENMKSWIETELERTYTKAFKAGQNTSQLDLLKTIESEVIGEDESTDSDMIMSDPDIAFGRKYRDNLRKEQRRNIQLLRDKLKENK